MPEQLLGHFAAFGRGESREKRDEERWSEYVDSYGEDRGDRKVSNIKYICRMLTCA